MTGRRASPERAILALKLKDQDGLTYAQIGERLGVSASGAKQLVANARAKAAATQEQR